MKPRADDNSWLLWQLADSAFPSGGFAHSGGLEAAWQQGEIRGPEELASFIDAALWQTAAGALPFVAAARDAPERFSELDDQCDAFLSNHVANRASRLQGRAFLNSSVRIFPSVAALRVSPSCAHLAPVFGVIACALKIGRSEAAELFLFQALRGLIAAAVRLGVAGPMEGQALQYRLGPRAREILELTECGTLDAIATVNPLLENLARRTRPPLFALVSNVNVMILHHHDGHDGHGHTHEPMAGPGLFHARALPIARDFSSRAFTVGVGGPVGSGKTALMLALCRNLRGKMSVAAVTNDIFTKEDGEFLIRHDALDAARIRAVETGGCPHAAIREDISANLLALEDLHSHFHPDILLIESGGDNLAAHFSRELADYTIYVIDVAGGDKIPRKGGPGITQSDLLVINKTDLAQAVGADLSVMDRDARKMRGDGAFLFAQVKHGQGVEQIVHHIQHALQHARGIAHGH